MRVGAVVGGIAAAALIAVPAAIAGGAQTPPQYAYVKGSAKSVNASLWIGRTGAKPRRLGAADTPLLSPDGDLVAASRSAETGAALTVFSTTGGAAHSFFNLDQQSAWPLAWSPDSRYVAVELLGDTGNGVAGSALDVIDTSTMTATTIRKGFVSGASFAPAGVGSVTDELVYSIASSEAERARTNLYTAAPDGTAIAQLTTNGRSLTPLWGRKGIVFDRERIRGAEAYPALQLWLLRGSKLTQLTHVKVPQLNAGLTPISVSASGDRILAELVGEDTSYAWRVQLWPRRISVVKVKGDHVQGAAISRNGRRLLVDQGQFERPPDDGVVEWLPFFGGHAHRLAHGAEPSWDE